MLSNIFKRVAAHLGLISQDTPTPRIPADVPRARPSSTVQVFPRTSFEHTVEQEASAKFIELCRKGDLNGVIGSLNAHPNLAHSTEYMAAYAVPGSMTFHSGDGIDCMTAVQAAVFHGHTEILECLIRQGARVSEESVQCAAQKGNVDALRILLPVFKRNHADSETKIGPNAPMTDALVTACRAGHLQAATILLDYGAMLEGSKNFYRSGNPLAAAMGSSNPALVEHLIACGANVRDPDVVRCENYHSTNQAAIQIVKAARPATGASAPAPGC